MLTLALIAFAIALYALAAERLEQLRVTGPIIFLSLGMLVDLPSFSLVDLGQTAEVLRVTSVVTLTLLLFADASTIDLAALRRDAGVPVRLLMVGLPLTVALGTLVAQPLVGVVGVGVAALLAAILAPTDLSLGLAMFSDPQVPDRVRRSINVESGLNDGIAAPLVALFTAVAIAELDHEVGPIIEALREISIGAGVGVAVGAAGGWLLVRSVKAAWSTRHSRQIGAVAFALLAYTVAVAAHGNGFIAAFVAGLAFGGIARREAVESAELAEQSGTLLSLFVWFMFGMSVLPAFRDSGWAWQPMLYAALSLTLIRMVPVALSLIGSRMHPATTVLVGWFGPRGLASVVFLLQSLAALQEAGVDTTLIAAAASWTVLGSVILHGASAGPVAAWYGAKATGFAEGSPELEPTELPSTRTGVARPSSAG